MATPKIDNMKDSRKDNVWDNTYIAVEKWIGENNKIPSHSSKNPYERKLGHWCCEQRQYKKKGKLLDNRKDKLNKLEHWYWTNENTKRVTKTYDETTEEVEIWILEHGRIPSQFSDNDKGIRLGKWCSTQRLHKKRNLLSNDRITRLEKIENWSWEPKDSFDYLLKDLEEWINENGRLPLKSSNDETEKRLARWCDGQRRKAIFGLKFMPAEKIEKLNKIKGWTWEIKGFDEYLQHELEKLQNTDPGTNYDDENY